MKRLLTTLVMAQVMLVAGSATAVGAENFDPSKAYAVIAGVLEFQDPSFSGWSKEKRKDQELHDTLLEMGVPAGNMSLLLDQHATRANIEKSVAEVAAKAGKDSTFIFYYAGHGMKQPGGKTYFANYDVAGKDISGTGLAVDKVGELIKASFKGKRVLLWADCCYSGALASVAEALGKAGIAAASVTSADESNTSTNNWTFTMTVIHTLMGQGQADRNHDGKVTLAEMNVEVADSMKYRDSQKSGFSAHAVSDGLIFAEVAVESTAAVKWQGWPEPAAYVKATHGGKEKSGQVVARKGEEYVVEFWSYNDIAVARLPASALGRLKFVRYSPGDELNVLWGGQLYKAKILKVEGDFHRVTYPGWSSEWDEWVMSNRIIEPAEVDGKTGGGMVQVEWGGKWWLATILKEEGKRFLIHYVGWDSSWDEWVTEDRLKRDAGVAGADAEKVLVEWGGQWWPAVILKQEKDRYFISYPGWDSSWDEWVTKERIRFSK